jgi:hypothetical protein
VNVCGSLIQPASAKVRLSSGLIINYIYLPCRKGLFINWQYAVYDSITQQMTMFYASDSAPVSVIDANPSVK